MEKEVKLANEVVLKGVIVMNTVQPLKLDHVICNSVQSKLLGPTGKNYLHVHKHAEEDSKPLVANASMVLLGLMRDAISMHI